MKDKSLETLEKYVKNKKVLDIGCVCQIEKWARYDYIKSLNPYLLIGVDIVESSRENVECKDLCKKEDAFYMYDKYGKFDIIVMYDVIEHIDNTGLILENLKFLTRKDTLILISTPNAISDKWLNQAKSLKRTKINPDHVHWFCYQTLSYLFNRYGYKSIEVVSENLEPRLVQIFKERE